MTEPATEAVGTAGQTVSFMDWSLYHPHDTNSVVDEEWDHLYRSERGIYLYDSGFDIDVPSNLQSNITIAGWYYTCKTHDYIVFCRDVSEICIHFQARPSLNHPGPLH